MHKQRMIITVLAGVGVLTAFLPWVTMLGLAGVSGVDLREGWIVVGIFGAAIALAVTGARAEPLDGMPRVTLGVLGAGAAAFGVWRIIAIKQSVASGLADMGGRGAGRMMRDNDGVFGDMLGDLVTISFGLYAVVIVGAAVAIAAFVRGKS